MRGWQRLWLVLTLIWGAPWAMMLANNHGPFSMSTYLSALAVVVGLPSLALYGVFWALSGFSSK